MIHNSQAQETTQIAHKGGKKCERATEENATTALSGG